LRCPQDHEDSWLVLAATKTVDRHVLEGTLGCPVCGAEYPVSAGLADLRLDERSGAPDVDAATSSTPGTQRAYVGNAPEMALMLAAYAGLAEPGGTVGVGGELAATAGDIERLTSIRALAINPAGAESPGGSAIRCSGRLPLSADSLR